MPDRPTLRLAAALLTAAFLLAPSLPAAGQSAGAAAPGERLQVLFLGDDGLHLPALRVRELQPALAREGIDVFYTDRLEALTSDNLAQYDVLAIYANHTYLAPERERALLDYVAGGGGLVAIHAASAMFGNSDAYASLVGGVFKSHGAGTFTAERVRPDHPAVAGVPTVESPDETYVHTRHNPDKEVLAVRVGAGEREPWTWVRRHGDGRVFYTAWGHDERTWSTPGFRALVARGMRWAAGDAALAADFEPPPLSYMDADEPIPYYPQGVGWGVTGDPYTRVQQPLSPEASREQTALPPGFRMELFAAEPDVVNPIDMTWDTRGRLWVVETLDYPNTFAPERRGQDRVKILEDTDGDGRADRTTIFAEGLNIPTSLVLHRDGVIVAQVPDMLLLRDTDGDDRADVVDTLFTGWGTFDTHAGPSNLRYGFDNRIWGAVGYSGFDGVVGGDTLLIGQGFYRFTPDGTSLEHIATTDNNTWGLGFSEDGHVFGSTANNNPAVHVPIPRRYYDRLQGADDAAPVLPTIADASRFYPITDEVRQVDWHGRYTSGAGFDLYTARDFPRDYWNRAAFVGGPTGHLLGRFTLEPNGSTFIARNDWNLAASRDTWFSPIQARVGPDGAVWLIDWYNPIIQHNPTPPGYETGEGNAYEIGLRDRQHSRVWRVVYGDGSSEARPADLAKAAPETLVRTLRDDNLHWRLTAQRLLVERGRADVVPMLLPLVADVRTDVLGLSPAAVHALWTLHGLGALDGTDAEALAAARRALHHPSPAVQRAALMVLPAGAATLGALFDAGLLPDRAGPADTDYTVGSATLMAADPHVRLATLLAAADAPPSPRAASAVAELLLVPSNARDRWLRDAAAIAGAHHGEAFLHRLLTADLGGLAGDSLYTAGLAGAVALAAAHHAAAASPFLVDRAAALGDTHPVLATAYLGALADAWPEDAPPALSSSQRAAIGGLGGAGVVEARQRLFERWGEE